MEVNHKMKEVKLRMKEQEKYEIIKELVDHNGNKKRAKEKLGLTIRQVNRLIKKYKEKGKSRICSWKQIQKARKSIR